MGYGQGMTHPVSTLGNTPCHHTQSVCPLNTPYEYPSYNTLSSDPLNTISHTPYQINLSHPITHTLNTTSLAHSQHIPSTHICYTWVIPPVQASIQTPTGEQSVWAIDMTLYRTTSRSPIAKGTVHPLS